MDGTHEGTERREGRDGRGREDIGRVSTGGL